MQNVYAPNPTRLGPDWRTLSITGETEKQQLRIEYDRAEATSRPSLESIAQLRRLYIFREGRVEPFLDQHPFLIPIVLEAFVKIRSYFPDTPLALEVYVDHEIAGWMTLNIVIGIDRAPEEAVEQLQCLDWDWWLDKMLLTDEKMGITLGIV